MTIRQTGALLRSGKVSCQELVQESLRRARTGDCFNAFITITEEEALLEAEKRDEDLQAGRDRGPLHGIPTAHKDLFHTKGVRTTGGSLLYADFVPQKDAAAVHLLREAGAVSIGKTNMHELAFGITSKNPHYGTVRNPLDETRLAGGSSGGAGVVIATGLAPMALGTDTGGSIRIPASYCGVVGFKPTYGCVSRDGVIPLAFSLDHVGPLGFSVDDCALAMSVLSERNRPSFAEIRAADLKGLRVGVPERFFFDHVEAQVGAAIRLTIAEMEHSGAHVIPVRLPDIEEANVAAQIILLTEFAALHTADNNAAMFGSDVWKHLQQGRAIPGQDYVNAQQFRTSFNRAFNEIWERVDVLVTPATPIAAPRIDESTVRAGSQEEDVRMASTRLVRALNFVGAPALSMPCGQTREGLPIGLQLIAARSEDVRLLQVAAAIEALQSSRQPIA